MQGNFGWGGKFAVNFLYDYRRAPSLQLTNALLGQPQATVAQLLQTMSRDQVIVQSIGLTPLARASSPGVTNTFAPKWPASADYRLSVSHTQLDGYKSPPLHRAGTAGLLGCVPPVHRRNVLHHQAHKNSAPPVHRRRILIGPATGTDFR